MYRVFKRTGKIRDNMLLHTTRLYRINENEDIDKSKVILLGVPFDSTETNIPGQRLGPDEIRKRFIERGLGERYYNDIYDAGNVNVVHGNAERTISIIKESIREIKDYNKKAIPFILGGEHLISLGVYKALFRDYKDLVFVCFDAHFDLKKDYVGEKLSHSTVCRRVYEEGFKNNNPDNIVILGVRNEDREEVEFSKKIYKNVKSIGKRKVYLSIDLDVFDNSIMPGVSDPEPHGIMLNEFENFINKIDFKNVVGVDVVEFNPLIEKKISGVTASEVMNLILKKIINRDG